MSASRFFEARDEEVEGGLNGRWEVVLPGDEPPATQLGEGIEQFHPLADAEVQRIAPLEFTFSTGVTGVALVRLEIRDATQSVVLSAILDPATGRYTAPSWLPDKISGDALSWRVLGLDMQGTPIQSSTWRALKYAQSKH